jgi:hypothetical protein
MDSFKQIPGRFHLVKANPSPITFINPQFLSGLHKDLRLSAHINLSMAKCRRIDRHIKSPELVLFSIAASAPMTISSRHHKAASGFIANICAHILHRSVIQQFFHHFALSLSISVGWTRASPFLAERALEKPAVADRASSINRAISTIVRRKKNGADVFRPGAERISDIAFPALMLPKNASSTIKTEPKRRLEAEIEDREQAGIIKQIPHGSAVPFPRAYSVNRAISTIVRRKKNEADVFRPGAERISDIAFPALMLPKNASSTIKTVPGRRLGAKVKTREQAGIIKQTSPGLSAYFPRTLLEGVEKKYDQVLHHTAIQSITTMAINLSFKCSTNLYPDRVSSIMVERKARDSWNLGKLSDVHVASKGPGGSALSLVFSMPAGYAKATSHEEKFSENQSPYASPGNMQHSIANSSDGMGGKALQVAEAPRPSFVDLARVTDQVYAMLERKIKMEKERRGIYGI